MPVGRLAVGLGRVFSEGELMAVRAWIENTTDGRTVRIDLARGMPAGWRLYEGDLCSWCNWTPVVEGIGGGFLRIFGYGFCSVECKLSLIASK